MENAQDRLSILEIIFLGEINGKTDEYRLFDGALFLRARHTAAMSRSPCAKVGREGKGKGGQVVGP